MIVLNTNKIKAAKNYGFNITKFCFEEYKDNIWNIPELDGNMLKTGWTGVVHLDTGRRQYNFCSIKSLYLSNLHISIPNRVIDQITSIYDQEKASLLEQTDINGMADNVINTGVLCEDDLVNPNYRDKRVIKRWCIAVLMTLKDFVIKDNSFFSCKNGYYIKRNEFVEERDLLKGLVKLRIDAIRLRYDFYPFIFDLNKIQSINSYIGVSHNFKNIWLNQSSSNLLSDGYEVICGVYNSLFGVSNEYGFNRIVKKAIDYDFLRFFISAVISCTLLTDEAYIPVIESTLTKRLIADCVREVFYDQ